MNLSDFDIDPNHPDRPVKHPITITWRGVILFIAILIISFFGAYFTLAPESKTQAAVNAEKFAKIQSQLTQIANPFATPVPVEKKVRTDAVAGRDYIYYSVRTMPNGYTLFFDDPYMELSGKTDE